MLRAALRPGFFLIVNTGIDSAAPTFTSLHIIPHLGELLDRHPQLDMEVVLDDERIDLIDEGIDVSLRMGDLPDSALTVRRIGQSPRIVVATPSYLNRHGAPAHPADLNHHQGVVYAKGTGRDVWKFCKNGDAVLVTHKGRLRVSAAEGVRSAVLAGIGVAVASE